MSLRAAAPFLSCGGTGVVAGGLAAAVTGPTGWGRGSWVAAYLVLVVGVAQIGLGVGQAVLAARPPSRRSVTAECVLWNVSGALVIAGTLLDAVWLVAAGAAALLVALVVFARSAGAESSAHRTVGLAYRALLVLLVVSTPVGMALALLRS